MLAIMRLTATLSLDKDCALQLFQANITDKLLNELKCKHTITVLHTVDIQAQQKHLHHALFVL